MTKYIFAAAIAVFLVCGVAATSAATVVGFDDAVTWWRFGNDLTDSNAPPASDGTLHGSLGYVDAPSERNRSNGRAGDFSNDWIEFSTAASTELDTDWSTGLTAFGRVKFDTISPSQEIVNRDGYVSGSTPVTERSFALALFGGSSRGLGWRVWSGTNVTEVPPGYNWSSIAPPQADVYYDAVGVFRPGVAAELYINGELAGSNPTSFTSLNKPSGVNVAVGRREGGGSPGYLQGELESAALWNQALSAGEIKRLTVGPLHQTNAAAWLRFGNDYTDSNTPPASDGTKHGNVQIGSALPGSNNVGNNGLAASFDGNGDYLDLGLGGSNELDIDGSNGLTVFGRVYPNTVGGTIVSRDGFPGYSTPNYNQYRSFNLGVFGSSGPHFRVWNGTSEFMASAAPSGFYPDWLNHWHDVVGVFRPGEGLEIYVDGHLAGSSPLGITSINTPSGVDIFVGDAYLTGSGGWEFNGDMESVAIWPYALTPGEILALSVPEPGTWLIAVGLGAFGVILLRRRRGAPR